MGLGIVEQDIESKSSTFNGAFPPTGIEVAAKKVVDAAKGASGKIKESIDKRRKKLNKK